MYKEIRSEEKLNNIIPLLLNFVSPLDLGVNKVQAGTEHEHGQQQTPCTATQLPLWFLEDQLKHIHKHRVNDYNPFHA